MDWLSPYQETNKLTKARQQVSRCDQVPLGNRYNL